MGNTLHLPQIELSEISVDNGVASAKLSCSLSNPNTLQLILQDKQGRSVLTKDFAIGESTSELDFEVSSFEAGDYHAWLYIGNTTFVRHFKLEAHQKSGLFDKLVSMFK